MLDSVAEYAWLIAVAGLALTNLAWLHYLRAIARETVPRRPVGHSVVMVAGGAAGIAAVVAAQTPATWIILAVNLFLGGLFFWLLGQGAQPAGELIVAVGDTIAPFSSTDDSGAAFESSELSGKRVLLKFFRGHW